MTRNGKQIQTDRKQIKRHAGRVKGQLYSTNTTARVSDDTDGLCSIVIVQLVQHFNISSGLS